MTSTQHARLDYDVARQRLQSIFAQAELDFAAGQPIPASDTVVAATELIFASATQSYRETLLGLGLARLLDRSIDIRRPYVKLGPGAFSGRSLDEHVVNPFLHDRMIPCSKGPYLATFRRSVMFVPETGQGLRDTAGYQAFLDLIGEFERMETDELISQLLRFLLYHFVELRDASRVQLAHIARLSLDQYDQLIEGLINTPSGGLMPVLLTVAIFDAIRQCFNLDWQIDWQGINAADRATGVGGDITLHSNDRVILAVEVTERPIDRARVVSTFVTKIAPQGIEDYLFMSAGSSPSDDARTVVMQYFAQGHDVSFLQVRPWLTNNLATLGVRCRVMFTNVFLHLLESPSVPAALKVRWNDLVQEVIGRS